MYAWTGRGGKVKVEVQAGLAYASEGADETRRDEINNTHCRLLHCHATERGETS